MSLFGNIFGTSHGAEDIERLRYELEIAKSCQELGSDILFQYLEDKEKTDYWSGYEKPDPLVTVCVATYNRANLLTERTIPSILEQSYKNIEVIVVGDCCGDETEKRMAAIDDARVRFVNLPERGKYPADAYRRWMVAGTTPVNHALSMAKGDFITHLDDDDRYEACRIESLLESAVKHRAEMVWHPFHLQNTRGKWKKHKAEKYATGQVTTSSVFYHSWLTRIKWNIEAHVLQEPGDWNRFRKFNYFGIKKVRNPYYLLWHYREHSQGG